jgi:hypothetical protein
LSVQLGLWVHQLEGGSLHHSAREQVLFKAITQDCELWLCAKEFGAVLTSTGR